MKTLACHQNSSGKYQQVNEQNKKRLQLESKMGKSARYMTSYAVYRAGLGLLDAVYISKHDIAVHLPLDWEPIFATSSLVKLPCYPPPIPASSQDFSAKTFVQLSHNLPIRATTRTYIPQATQGSIFGPTHFLSSM